jgi:hypothetical protein
MSQIGAYTDKVDRWRNISQIQRWTASGLMDIEPRQHRVKGYRFLGILRFKLSEIVASRMAGKTLELTQKLVAVC